ncbi:unnamed protein product, partial [Mesorhabditis spiculigera]
MLLVLLAAGLLAATVYFYTLYKQTADALNQLKEEKKKEVRRVPSNVSFKSQKPTTPQKSLPRSASKTSASGVATAKSNSGRTISATTAISAKSHHVVINPTPITADIEQNGMIGAPINQDHEPAVNSEHEPMMRPHPHLTPAAAPTAKDEGSAQSASCHTADVQPDERAKTEAALAAPAAAAADHSQFDTAAPPPLPNESEEKKSSDSSSSSKTKKKRVKEGPRKIKPGSVKSKSNKKSKKNCVTMGMSKKCTAVDSLSDASSTSSRGSKAADGPSKKPATIEMSEERKGGEEYSDRRLFISNFPFSWHEDDLRAFLEDYGPVMEVNIVYNERGSKGFGFATIDDPDRCYRARMELNHTVVQGRRVESEFDNDDYDKENMEPEEPKQLAKENEELRRRLCKYEKLHGDIDEEIYYESNPEESQYLDQIRRIIASRGLRTDRTGTGTISLFGMQSRYSLRDGRIPLLTTKRVFWRGIAEELLWFVSGCTDANVLKAKKIHFWDDNGGRAFLDNLGLHDRAEGDLGPVYGFQWRHFGAEYQDCRTDYSGPGSTVQHCQLLSADAHDRTCLRPEGDFVHTLGDAHVYSNHVEALQEQLRRVPTAFPRISFAEGIKSIDDFTMEKIHLHNYNPQGTIAMKMAV